MEQDLLKFMGGFSLAVEHFQGYLKYSHKVELESIATNKPLNLNRTKILAENLLTPFSGILINSPK